MRRALTGAASVLVTIGTVPVSAAPAASSDKQGKEPEIVEIQDENVKQAEEEREARQPTQPATPGGGGGGLFESAAPTAEELQSIDPERRSNLSTPGATLTTEAGLKTVAATDAGDALDKSASSVGMEAQRRNPISSDTRIRGYHVGQVYTQADGAFWFPARQDMDTMLSKIDSGIIQDIIVLKGPYSARYGPGFSFIDIVTRDTERYQNGCEIHGRTNLNYQTNGQQLYGRETIWGGSSDWGFRLGYGHRIGNDYDTGDGDNIPSSYNSRDIDGALGFDLSPDSRLEFRALRLDQTDTEYPGQVFDIDFLVTDGYNVRYILENQCYYDQLVVETWYNRTRFEGNAQQSGKRQQIPELNSPQSRGGQGILNFTGFTDVDEMSTGFRAATTWGEAGCAQLTLGVDLRYLNQELNEFDVFDAPGSNGALANFPIPRSHSADPGLFVEYIVPMKCDRLTIKTGARVDFVSTDIDEIPTGRTEAELQAILGADNFDQGFDLWSAYITAEYKMDCHWTASTGFGAAQRPPTLTELYAVDPFLAVLQQGFTQVRGNTDLHAEKLWQFDLGVRAEYERFRGGIGGFYAWVNDYITYLARDDTLATIGIDGGLGVTFTNTDLATLSGGEIYGEYDCNDWLTPFATMSYVEGRDHSRDGRGVIPGSDEEPLPSIYPLQTRLGLRFHQACPNPAWGIELSARVVDNQDRVASSLLEQESPGFTTYDLRTYWRATDNLLLLAGVENFTDKYYHEHLDLRTGRGVFQPGISFYFGLEWTY